MTQQAGEEGGLNQTYRGTGGWGDAVVLHQLNHWNYIFDNYFQLIEAQAPTKVLITCGQRFLVHAFVRHTSYFPASFGQRKEAL